VATKAGRKAPEEALGCVRFRIVHDNSVRESGSRGSSNTVRKMIVVEITQRNNSIRATRADQVLMADLSAGRKNRVSLGENVGGSSGKQRT
jgi:hypothetical protein